MSSLFLMVTITDRRSLLFTEIHQVSNCFFHYLTYHFPFFFR